MIIDSKNNRELWLNNAIVKLEALFAENDYTVPSVRVSVGFPLGRGGRNQVIGQCWSASATADGLAQIFIDPSLTDSKRVMDVLAHELIHAIVGTEAGHKGAFKQCALSIGLEGKMTATTASPALNIKLEQFVTELGDYPHAKLDPSKRKKDSTRMIKTECEECGYIAYTSRKWLEVGTPICPSDNNSMVAKIKEEE